MLNDGELVKRCNDGDSLAQKEFYERFAPRMMGVCYRYAQNKHEAEDILQDGFVRAFRYLKDFRGDGSLEGWLRRIMVTTALNYLKSQKHFRSEFELQLAKDESHDATVLDQMETKEVMDMIQELSPGYRAVLNLFAVEGFSHKEIGEQLGIGESTSRSQYVRARQMLLKKLEERSRIGLQKERLEHGK